MSAAAPRDVEPTDVGVCIALAGLPEMGPARLRAVVEAASPGHAWREVVAGRALALPGLAALLGRRGDTVAAGWARAAARIDPARVAADHAHLSVCSGLPGPPTGASALPGRLGDDVEPPVLLFADGDLDALEGPTVAIVGTRRCTRAGAEMAAEVGRACASAGIRVVSGLAVGIDAAAHEGALAAGPGAAPPIGVVGSGLDVIYPARSRRLWSAVATTGVVLSEYPLGTEPARWRFPARNRLVAALADVVVVVESPRAGGSMYTVDEALRRDRTVLAVPGPVRSAASAGTNWLLSQGASVACSTDDVLVACGAPPVPLPDRAGPTDPRPRPTGDGRRVLRALGWSPATVDALARRTGLGLGALAVALDRLEADRWVDRTGGRVDRRSAP